MHKDAELKSLCDEELENGWPPPLDQRLPEKFLMFKNTEFESLYSKGLDNGWLPHLEQRLAEKILMLKNTEFESLYLKGLENGRLSPSEQVKAGRLLKNIIMAHMAIRSGFNDPDEGYYLASYLRVSKNFQKFLSNKKLRAYELLYFEKNDLVKRINQYKQSAKRRKLSLSFCRRLDAEILKESYGLPVSTPSPENLCAMREEIRNINNCTPFGRMMVSASLKKLEPILPTDKDDYHTIVGVITLKVQRLLEKLQGKDKELMDVVDDLGASGMKQKDLSYRRVAKEMNLDESSISKRVKGIYEQVIEPFILSDPELLSLMS